ncbi:MAG: ABC transporter permease, partial [Gemmatimonadaceae bacterium]
MLERALLPELSSPVIGDLLEQRDRGALWMLAETISALWHLHRRPRVIDGVLHAFLSDLRIAARLLLRSPGFAIASVLTLGLAIGATTAIFSVVEPVLIRSLPYPDAGRLVLVWERDRDGGRDNLGFATFRDLVAQSSTLERAAAIGDWQPTLSDNNDPERLQGDRVSWTYFRTLGVRPLVGRDFTADEDMPGHNDVVILSYGLWQRRYGGDAALIGKSISVNGRQMIVVGVMPKSFDNAPTPTAKIWRVLGYLDQPYACRTCHHLRMIARIRSGATLEQTRAELGQIQSRLVKAYPKDYASVGLVVGRVQDEVTLGTRPALLALCAAVVLVLLIAVANVVSLQLARAIRRGQEFA